MPDRGHPLGFPVNGQGDRWSWVDFYIDNYIYLCNYPSMMHRTTPSGSGSRSARAAAALSAKLFSPAPKIAPPPDSGDPQSCIRAALRRRRRALGLTQEKAARLLGMPRLTYHRIETGARHIHFADLAAICEMFDCAPGELLQDTQLAVAFARVAARLQDPRA